jgi:hypothetical protein
VTELPKPSRPFDDRIERLLDAPQSARLRKDGAPVGPYPHVYPCTAAIRIVTLERLSDLSPADRQALAEREFRASVSSQ